MLSKELTSCILTVDILNLTNLIHFTLIYLDYPGNPLMLKSFSKKNCLVL